MGAVADRAAEIAATLALAGIRTTLDHRSLNPPAAWVAPPNLTIEESCGWVCNWTVWLVSPNAGDPEALELLTELVDKAESVLPIERADPDTFTTGNGGDPFPAYRISFSEGV